VTFTLSPSTYRRITGWALFFLAAIVVTGGAVRLTGSGLGCPDWPTCEYDQFAPESGIHGWVEFGNRLITGLVSVAVILAVLGSVRRAPRRNDLLRWSWGLVAGMVGQIVLGGIVVLSHLNPWLVLGHFGLSMVLIWNAVVLHHKAGDHPEKPAPLFIRRLSSILVGWALIVLATGTLVTGSGPHTGSREDPIERLPFAITEIARVHGSVVVIFLLLVTLFGTQIFLHPETKALQPWARLLALVVVGQAALGWTQYFTGVPEILVGLHIAGATALWATLVKIWLTAAGSS
jgi:cytochrome c oxidase assembly protein subunit 15